MVLSLVNVNLYSDVCVSMCVGVYRKGYYVYLYVYLYLYEMCFKGFIL